MKNIKKFFNYIISAIYPNKCICCSGFIDEGNYLCDNCYTSLERNNLDNLCFDCGFEKDSCVCKYNVYRFKSLVCVFKNKDKAKKAYYLYKFSKRQHYENFFTNEMCNAFNKCYASINFDYICSVPPTKRCGYDHSGYIARHMSETLNIPYAKNILSCCKKTKKQHNSTIKERLLNTEGKFKFNYRIDNANILLIDDIKTTGATIDECAKVLLYAGANSVYCMTVMGTVN